MRWSLPLTALLLGLGCMAETDGPDAPDATSSADAGDGGARDGGVVVRDAGRPPPRDAGPELIISDDGSSSGTLDPSATTATLRARTSLPARCRYSDNPDWGYDLLSDEMATTDELAHQAEVEVGPDQQYEFHIRCKTADDRYSKVALTVRFSTTTASQELVIAAAGDAGLLVVYTERWQRRLFHQVLLCPGSYTDNGHNDPLYRGIGVGGGRVIAGGGGFYEGYVRASADGQAWATRQRFLPPTPITWLGDITYGGGVWAAVGGNSTRAWSTDGGETWQGGAYHDSKPSDPEVAHRGMHYGGGRFVGVGNVGGAHHSLSADGETWTPVYTDTHPDAAGWEEAAYGAGGFVLRHGGEYDGGIGGFLPGVLAFIPDGSDTPSSHAVVTANQGLAFGNGWFVVPAVDTSAWVSPDGMNWTRPCMTCCVGTECATPNTPDGLTGDCSAATYQCGGQPTQVAFGGGRFYSLGPQGGQTFLLSSADGINWVQDNVSEEFFYVRDLDVGYLDRPAPPAQDAPILPCDPSEDGDDSNN